jgi:hypothetical protein
MSTLGMASSSIRLDQVFAETKKQRRLLGLGLLAIAAVSGCAAEYGELNGDAAASSEQALIRGGGSRGINFSCSGGTCTCDKSIENDCEDMSGVCTDATVDPLIDCIEGWLTTHCTCTQAFASPKAGSIGVLPSAGVYSSR